ncbi:MAG: sigma-54 dependent transcriptional regulator [Candidatus Cloacimonetes bacterium]|nr:sigma-54 dependent transcriptional regulator [Candidatus Cloacimonadota bacterium]
MKILIIDDEKSIGISLKNIFDDEGYFSKWVTSCAESLPYFEKWEPDLIYLDVKIKEENGIEFLETLREKGIDTPVVMISGHSGIKEAVQAMKAGAFDFLEKPLNLTRIKLTARNAFEFSSLKNNYSRLKDDFIQQYKIIGNSPKLLDTLEIVKKLAKTNSKVLIRGESGTGKELVAFALHNLSSRSNMPFIKFNSAAIPLDLIESELFGHEKGAFTGAVSSKKGKIELADKGTLFLDEIGDMSLSAQSKILRVLQEGELQRVGSNETILVNTRIIAATHKNLEEMITQGLFREDLFYRLNVVPITCPPLRERKSDIPILVDFFCKKFSFELNMPQKIFTKEALEMINQWSFPGNVRELKNMIERLYIFVDDNEIKIKDIENCNLHSYKIKSLSLNSNVDIDNLTYFLQETKPFNDKKDEFERLYLKEQLEKNDFNVSKTAQILQMQQSNLSRKIKELKIEKTEER